MALNPSGPISLGGTTAGQSIAIENGGPGTATISLNDAAVRSLAGVPSGVIVMPTDFYGKSNIVTINLVISANTQNYDVYSNRGPTYVPGKSNITVTVNPGVLVGSSSTATYAMLVPSAFSPADSVTIVNNGTIIGRGASGGNGEPGVPAGGPFAKASTPGGTGGNAIYVNRPTTITNNGSIYSGGGGGGGSARIYMAGGPIKAPFVGSNGGGGGGGGAGYSGGTGGTGGGNVSAAPGNPGGTGSTLTGGSGGASGSSGWLGNLNYGGNGGGAGAAGAAGITGVSVPTGGSTPSPGGGTGNYITGNGFVTWPATGTRGGNVA